jgi:hypothetical protein
MALRCEPEIQNFFRAHEDNVVKFDSFLATMPRLVDDLTTNVLTTGGFMKEVEICWIVA